MHLHKIIFQPAKSRFTALLYGIWLTLYSLQSLSSDSNAQHSYQSCTHITTELLTTVQLHEREIPLDLLIESLPNLTAQGEERVKSTYEYINKSGTLSAYSAINSDFAKCAKQVFSKQGKPKLATNEYGYYYCSGENKLRYEIALAIYLKANQQDVIPQLPPSRQKIGAHYYKLADKEGLGAVFELMANSLKHCVNQIPPKDL